MASSDVIELGSSDDEEPVPKKKKPALNAMVQFPNEVPGLVIKSVKPAIPNLQKVLAGGAVTITNVKNGKVNTQVNKAKPNGKSFQRFVQKPTIKIPIVRNVNPLNLMKKQQNARVQSQKLGLPPGITVKRTATSPNSFPTISSSRRKQILKRKHPQKIITTVELDDEEIPLTSNTGPQWYLRPEEQTHHPVEEIKNESKDEQNNDLENTENMELQNNKEPDTSKYIEIIIEDSPIKPLQIMRGFEIGSEIPITLEDSPVKSINEPLTTIGSDSEKSNVTEPQSKKRLDYPNDDEHSAQTGVQNIVEIDFEISPSADKNGDNRLPHRNSNAEDETKMDTAEQEAGTSNSLVTELINTKEVKDENKLNKTRQINECGEFHPVYAKFINLCFELEDSDDMSKIVEKKIKTYYRQCPKEYVESEEFIDMVSGKIYAMKAAPDKMYLYIKDIVDELNLQRKSAKAVEISNKENKEAEDNNYFVADEAEYDSKRCKQIRKLDKTIKKLHRAVQKLEEQEVDFEDEEDSVYLLTERYKERLIRVHAKFCQLTNTKMPSEPRIQIEPRPGVPAGPAKRVEKWVNKKVPIGAPLPFPDFHDVLHCVRVANDEDRLGWNEADIMEEARDLFTRCGKKLQKRRQENEWRVAVSRLPHDVSTLDPAENSDSLKVKLEENKSLAAKKETELLNRYADKQNQLKLVGEEIGDKEAEESPVESEDDEGNDESNSLEDKQNRKKRLKRLLHEKTRKISSEKENITSEGKVNEGENKLEENAVMEVEEKKECEAILDETKNKINVEERIETKVNSNDVSTNISTYGSTNEQNEVKSKDTDLYDVDSDIDELHLLQKLYSESEMNSSTQESDSDTPIAISDTLDSDSDNDSVRIQQTDDIISIENSSYSESEETINKSENQASKILKQKSNDCVLLENLLHPTTSRDKFDIYEENILLASSEEDSLDAHLNADKISNVNSAHNDSEVILDNGDEILLGSNVKTYEVPLSEEKINIDITRTMFDPFENNRTNTTLKQIGCNDTVNQQHDIQICEIDKLRSPLITTDKDQNNLEEDTSKSKNIITIEVPSDKTNSIPDVVSDIGTEVHNEIANLKPEVNMSIKNASMINENQSDKDELNITTDKEITSECHKENLEECVSYSRFQGADDNNGSVSNNVKTVSSELNSNDCETMNVNVEIAGDNLSLKNQQATCEDVEMATGVQ